AHSLLERSLYDRCITRGVMGSLLPTIYNNGNESVQGPGYVVIRNEMIHEARVVPLDGRPDLAVNITSYMGASRGRWEGNTLVVVTKNLNGLTGIGGNGGGRSNERIKSNEPFTMLDKDTLQYTATIDDPGTWTRPWTLSFPWKREPVYGMFEYACHEGNYAMRNMLSASRAADTSGRRERLRHCRASSCVVPAAVRRTLGCPRHGSIPTDHVDGRPAATVLGRRLVRARAL